MKTQMIGNEDPLWHLPLLLLCLTVESRELKLELEIGKLERLTEYSGEEAHVSENYSTVWLWARPRGLYTLNQFLSRSYAPSICHQETKRSYL